MKYYVYVLISERDGKRYIGVTADIERRIQEHNTGLVISTRSRRPLRLAYTESYQSKEDALKREKFFKTGKGREYLKTKNIK